MADALGIPWRKVQLRFRRASWLPFGHCFGSRLTWRSDEPLQAPWPPLVLAAGRKSVAAALWIQRRSGGKTRLIHVNRPRAPLDWFDLIITTPQFLLPPRPNIVCSLLPFLGTSPQDQDLPTCWQAAGAALPRPWTVVLVGGHSPPYALDGAAAGRLAALINTEVSRTGGSAWVLASPRTPEAAMALIEQGLTVPVQLVRWRQGDNPYGALRRLGDRFIVTGDSASMLAEAVLTGKPVLRFELSLRPDWRWRLVAAWRALAERRPGSWRGRMFQAALAAGLITSVKDMAHLHRAWEEAGLFDASNPAPALAARERRATVDRILALLESSRASVA